jgi:hypothetical protein
MLFAVTVRARDDEEQRQLRVLMRELSLMDGWVERVERGLLSVPAGSPLAGDDRRAAPFQVSHAVAAALVVAVDHVHCLRRSIDGCTDCRPHQLTFLLNSYYSLLRGAMENAARVVWLLAPEQRPERVLRRLRLQAGNVIQSDDLCEAGGFPRTKPKVERLQRVKDIAQQAGVSPSDAVQPAGKRAIIRAAGQYIGGNATQAEVLWRACSAAAHGDTWAALSLHERDVTAQVDQVLTVRTAASTHVLTTFVVETMAIIKTAFSLRDLRSQPPY